MKFKKNSTHEGGKKKLTMKQTVAAMVAIAMLFAGGYTAYGVVNHNNTAHSIYSNYSQMINKNKVADEDTKEQLQDKLTSLEYVQRQIEKEKSSLKISVMSDKDFYQKLSKSVKAEIGSAKEAIAALEHAEELEVASKAAAEKVTAAESSKSDDDINAAQELVTALSDEEQADVKAELQGKIDALKKAIADEKAAEAKAAEEAAAAQAAAEQAAAEQAAAQAAAAQSSQSSSGSGSSGGYSNSGSSGYGSSGSSGGGSSSGSSGGSSSGGSSGSSSGGGGGWVNVRPENNGQYGTASDESMVPEGAVVQP